MAFRKFLHILAALAAAQFAYADNASIKLWSDRVRENIQGLTPIQRETVLSETVYSLALLGKYDTAHDFSTNVSEPYFLPDLLQLIAIQQALSGDINKISDTIEKIIEKEKRDYAWHQVIQRLLEDGKIQDAKNLFRHIRALPSFENTLQDLAVAQKLSGDKEGANATLEQIQSPELRKRAMDAVLWTNDADNRVKRLAKGFIKDQIEMLVIGLDGVFDREVDAIIAVQVDKSVDLDQQVNSLLAIKKDGEPEGSEATTSKICLIAIASYNSGRPDKAEEFLRTAKKTTDGTWRNLTTGFARSILSYLLVALKMDIEAEQMLYELRNDAPSHEDGQFQVYDGTIEGFGVAYALRSTGDSDAFYEKCKAGYERALFAAHMLRGIACLPRQ